MADLADVAPIPPVPLHDLLTYRVPDALRARVQPGTRVRIPLGRQMRTGVVAGFAETAPPGTLRAIADVLDVAEPFLPAELLALCRWTARYYLTSLADVIATIVPSAVPGAARERVVRLVHRAEPGSLDALARRAPARVRAYSALVAAPGAELSVPAARAAGVAPAAMRALVAAGWAEVVDRDRATEAVRPPAGEPRSVTLTGAQDTAVDAIGAALCSGTSTSFLLHGITGSGKTEVFLAAAERTLAAGLDVLLLVPEIALTHQLVERVRSRFAGLVAVAHSGLGPRERWNEWRRIHAGAARVVVGARSAVFAPVRRIGLVVVDEEHDQAYKQEEGLRYNARDLAVVRARLAGAVAVLASATPSAESYQAARDGRHILLTLPERATANPLPAVEIVDLRGRTRTQPRLVTDELRRALEANLARGGQTLVFLNRRGFATYLQCPACGTPVSCPRCSVTLTWHRAVGALVCHHCHHRRRPPGDCPECHGAALEPFGVGTEQIEAGLRACYPLAVVGRLDRDASRRRGAQQRILRDWRSGDTDILVGTQMVSKGHDVPGVTLVAVLLADLSLNVPDFRAGERTLQLLVQVAGRAGRGDDPGRVVVQTLRPDHPSVAAVIRHDYTGFMEGELARRRALGYPPFARLVNLRLDGTDEATVERVARDLAARLRAHAPAAGLGEDTVLGAAPAPLARVRGRHRWQVLLRGADVPKLRALARAARASEAAIRKQRVRLVIDVDPYSLL